nr:hypothetical protein CFP56_77613 [Quercus suber]
MARFQRSRPTMPHEENRVNNENSTRTMSNTRLLLTLIIAKGDDDEMRSHGGVANDNLNTEIDQALNKFPTNVELNPKVGGQDMDGNGELGLVNIERGDVVAPHGQEVHPIPLNKDNLSLGAETVTSFSTEEHSCVHITNADFVCDNVHGGSKENFVSQKDKEILDLRQRNWKKLPVHTIMDTTDILLEPPGMKRKDRDKEDQARLEIENSKKQKSEKEAIVLGVAVTSDGNSGGLALLWKPETLVKVVTDSWPEGLNKLGGSQFTNCIDSCRDNLRVWNKVEFGHVERKIAEL